MVFEGLIWKLYKIAEVIAKIVYLNLLWVVFSLLGVVALGLFPATAAMFSVIRKWLIGENDIPIFKTFLEHYKSEFVQTNLLGYAMILLGAVLYIDLRFFQSSGGIITLVLSYFFLFLLLVYFVVLLYIFPVFVHYQFKTFEYIKYALILAVGRPFQTIFMIVGSLLVLTLLRMVPILIIYIGGSLLCYVLMRISIKSFPKEETQE